MRTGTAGILLRDGKIVQEIHRSPYHADAFRYPVCWNPIFASPTATSSSSERIDVFVRGTDSQLYRKTWQGHTGWANYVGVGAATTFR